MSLFEQLQTLHHAEAMLLVDDRQAQLAELDVRLEQRVRADRDVRQAFGDQLLQLRLSRVAVFDPVSRIGT